MTRIRISDAQLIILENIREGRALAKGLNKEQHAAFDRSYKSLCMRLLVIEGLHPRLRDKGLAALNVALRERARDLEITSASPLQRYHLTAEQLGVLEDCDRGVVPSKDVVTHEQFKAFQQNWALLLQLGYVTQDGTLTYQGARALGESEESTLAEPEGGVVGPEAYRCTREEMRMLERLDEGKDAVANAIRSRNDLATFSVVLAKKFVENDGTTTAAGREVLDAHRAKGAEKAKEDAGSGESFEAREWAEQRRRGTLDD